MNLKYQALGTFVPSSFITKEYLDKKMLEDMDEPSSGSVENDQSKDEQVVEFQPQEPSPQTNPLELICPRKLQKRENIGTDLGKPATQQTRRPPRPRHREEIASFDSDYEAFSKRIKEMESEIDNKIELKMQQLIEKQKKEADEHMKEWNNPTKKRYYMRDSTELKNLKSQMEVLVRFGLIDDSKSLEKRIILLQSQEEKVNIQNAESAYRKSRELLRKRQQKEREVFESGYFDKKALVLRIQMIKKTEDVVHKNEINKVAILRPFSARKPAQIRV